MEKDVRPEPDLVEEIVELLLTKYETLPRSLRGQIVPASIEAVAWIAASETAAYCRSKDGTLAEAVQRNSDCKQRFAAELEKDLASSLTY